MTFKLYDDKSSVLKKNTRYVQGGTTEVFPKHLGWWEQRLDIPKNQVDDIPFTITRETAFRPDKVAYGIYGRSDLTWLVLQYNEIIDINTQFVPGVVLKLPSPLRTFSSILTNPIRYQPVK